jgi:subtilisin family serine protease
MKIIDCEWGWRFTHEVLSVNQGGVVVGTNSTDVSHVNHGTAVAGVVGGDTNFIGITGIAPNALFSGSSFVGQPVGAAIKAAADKLRIGDVILLEIHRPGPNARTRRQGQRGFIAIEWWPDALLAIRYAVAKGIIVVEAAGNGGENLDAAIYNTRPSDFPTWWRNPFTIQNPSSGAILVGAKCPPPGTHGRNHGPDHSRLDLSNWGARVDCQGWSREVTTTGYGDLQGGVNLDLWYTDRFSGTSSASPIVMGAVLVVQGIRKKAGRILLTSKQFRSLLRSTGSPQQASPIAPVTQRIGKRPDLRRLIPAAMSLP